MPAKKRKLASAKPEQYPDAFMDDPEVADDRKARGAGGPNRWGDMKSERTRARFITLTVQSSPALASARRACAG
ncbi:MAG TPA: hypothetical protein VGR35_01255 [Tepidisphaeraceae bacterium]|nr:hypothetical protein [Tepidisphaeraceae bacterium]